MKTLPHAPGGLTDPTETAVTSTGVAVELAVPVSEFESRLQKLRERFAAENLGGGLYFAPEDIYYLSGYNTFGHYYGFQALVVPTERDPFFVIRFHEAPNIATHSVIRDKRIFTDLDNPAELTIAALQENGLLGLRLEVDGDSFAIRSGWFTQIYEAVGRNLADTRGRHLRALRRVKSDAEVALIRQAATVVRAGMDAAIKAIKPGATEDDVAAACFTGLIQAGGEYPGMPPQIANGRRAGSGHVTWEGHSPIRQGDVVLLEIPGCVKRYHAVQERSVSVGAPSAEAMRRMGAVVAARQSALGAIRPGNPCSAVDRALRAPLEEAGLSAGRAGTRSGYSLGIAYPPKWDEGEFLSLNSTEDTPLEPNMVFHVLASIVVPGEMHLGCTETVLVTPAGCEVLTPFPTGFVEV